MADSRVLPSFLLGCRWLQCDVEKLLEKPVAELSESLLCRYSRDGRRLSARVLAYIFVSQSACIDSHREVLAENNTAPIRFHLNFDTLYEDKVQAAQRCTRFESDQIYSTNNLYRFVQSMFHPELVPTTKNTITYQNEHYSWLPLVHLRRNSLMNELGKANPFTKDRYCFREAGAGGTSETVDDVYGGSKRVVPSLENWFEHLAINSTKKTSTPDGLASARANGFVSAIRARNQAAADPMVVS